MTIERVKELLPGADAELLEYFETLANLAEKGINLQFKNEGPSHAFAVMANIFSNAKEHVRIFAGNFKGDVCDTPIYLEALDDYLKQGASRKLDVVFETANYNKDSQAFKLLKKYKSQVSVAIASEPGLAELKHSFEGDSLFHFTTGDNKAYRCEIDTQNYKALCNFDDTKWTGRFVELFESLKQTSTAISL